MKKTNNKKSSGVQSKTKLALKHEAVLHLTYSELQYVAGASNAAGCTSGQITCETW